MKNFGMLFKFELKKIVLRKSTWIAFAALAAFLALINIAPCFGTDYIEGEVSETHAEGIKIDKEFAKKLSGRAIDQNLLEEMQKAYHKTGDLPEDLALFQKEFRPYKKVYQYIRYLAGKSDINPLSADESQVYQARDDYIRQTWEKYGLSEREINYWEAKEEKIEKPFVYQYAQAFDTFTMIDGSYMVCLFAAFFIAVCCSLVFCEEHSRKTDQLILCSRFGRKEIYFVRMLSGIVVSFCATLILAVISVVINFILYGTDGFSALIQLAVPVYSYPLSMGELFFLTIGMLLLSSIVTAAFTLMISEMIHSSVGTMSVIIAAAFLARLIEVPPNLRLFSQIWNYLPVNFMNSGMTDIRLVFGALTSWQTAPVLYILLTVMFVLLGKKIYCSYQVSGR